MDDVTTDDARKELKVVLFDQDPSSRRERLVTSLLLGTDTHSSRAVLHCAQDAASLHRIPHPDVILCAITEPAFATLVDGHLPRVPCDSLDAIYRLLAAQDGKGPPTDVYVVTTSRAPTALDVLSMLISGIAGLASLDRLPQLIELALDRRKVQLSFRRTARPVLGDAFDRLRQFAHNVHTVWDVEFDQWLVMVAAAEIPRERLRVTGRPTLQNIAGALASFEDITGYRDDGHLRKRIRPVGELLRDEPPKVGPVGEEGALPPSEYLGEDDEEDYWSAQLRRAHPTEGEAFDLCRLPMYARHRGFPQPLLPIRGVAPRDSVRRLYEATREVRFTFDRRTSVGHAMMPRGLWEPKATNGRSKRRSS